MARHQSKWYPPYEMSSMVSNTPRNTPKMGHPNCDAMKKKMSLVEPSITAEDIDALPWLHDGLRLNIAKMNALYLK